jgi:hypothetical protein
MERETKTITLPISQRIVELKSYLIGREKVEITRTAKSGQEVEAGFVAVDLMIKFIVVGIDGKREPEINIKETILDLHSVDYDFLINEIGDIAQDKEFTQKKTV